MTPDMFRKLAALGLSNEQMIGVLEIMEADAEARKAKVRTRVQKWRDKRSEMAGNVTERYVTTEDVTSGLTRGEDNLSKKTISGKEKIDAASRPKKGSRLPGDFAPDIDWAVSQGLSRRDAESQAQRFRDYWLAKPGAAGVKLDWPATWRNWVRSHADRAGVASTPVLVVDEARWKTRLTAARQKLQWSRKDWGPMPREPGCLVPAELLQDGDGVGWSEWQQVA